jgi:uncharacterized membrane protein
MELPAFLKFASDATMVGLWAAGFYAIALLALVGDWRRARRRQIDRVGCMPWTPVFMGAMLIGSGLFLIALKGWLSG